MATTLRRSRHHAAGYGTMRHCVALVKWSDDKYSSHYEVTHADGSTFYDTGHYFDGPSAHGEALRDFAKRMADFERRYAKFLEDVDVHVLDDGSIMLLTPRTDRAITHFDEHMPDDVQMMGNGYAVERRYVDDIVQDMREQGFTFTSTR